MVPVEGVGSLRNHLLQKLVPALLGIFVEATAPNVVLVGVLLPRMMSELQPRAEPAPGEEAVAHARAESDDHLHAFALDGAKALYSRVVGHTRRLLPALLQLRLQREVCPLGVQVEGAEGGAALHRAGKPNRNAIELGQRGAELVEPCHHQRGRRNGWRWIAYALTYSLAGSAEQHGLQPRAANVDCQRDGAFGFRSGAGLFNGSGFGSGFGFHQERIVLC